MTRSRIIRTTGQYALTVFGAALYAAGIRFFLYPNSIITGGITGISMIVNYLTDFPIGVLTIILNVPLFILAWKRLGFSLFLSSLVGMATSSVFVDLFELLNIAATNEPLLAALYGGLISGVGQGLVYRAGATTGGFDIAAKLLRQKYQYINLGTISLGLNAAVVAAFAVIFRKFDSAMYAVIAMFISSRAMDLILYGAAYSKLCFIITDSSSAVKDAINDKLHRGATLLHGEGAYSGADKEVILCAVKQQQIVELRKLVREIDENSFLVFTTAQEVFGKGFGDIMDNS